VWKGREKAFMPQMKAIWCVRRQKKVLHDADGGHFEYGDAEKRPSCPR